MENFTAEISKDQSGRLTMMAVSFDAREVFCKSKGTIHVNGTINGTAYRSRLLSRGGGEYVMVLDKALQKSIGFDGKALTAHVTMASDDLEVHQEEIQEPVTATCGMDVLTAVKTRHSVRKFTSAPISDELLNTILYAGRSAPTAKDKRPCHFIVIRDRQLLEELARNQPSAAMLGSAPCAIVVCGDKNIESAKEFMYADCAAATQNMLLTIHGLGLGGVWCGVPANSDWRKLMIDRLALPVKLPVAAVAAGWPDEAKSQRSRWETNKLHYDKW